MLLQEPEHLKEISSTSPAPSRSRHRWLLIAAPLAILTVLALATTAGIHRMESGALELAETGKAAIALLGEYGTALVAADLPRLLDCYADTYSNPSQGRWTETSSSDRDGVQVYDWRESDPRPVSRSNLEELLADFLDRTGELDKVKFKLDRVEDVSGDRVTARTVLWLRGHRSAESDGGLALRRPFESFAQFRLELTRDPGGFKILRQELLEGHTVTGERGGFVEVAGAVGVDFLARRNPRFATEEWYPERFQIIKYGSAGVTAADYDGDGWDDLFFADGAASRLYRNQGAQGEVTFADVTAEAGLPTDLDANVAIFADFDNDGDQDLFTGVFTRENRLFRNDGPRAGGGATFTDVTDGAGLGGTFVTVAAAGDADNDGLLDLYVGRYLDPRSELPDTLFYTRNGMGNSLLHNLGDLRFADVTESAGVREGGLTLGVAWADYDNDGDQDLYVANDFGRNALLSNDGPAEDRPVTFTDVSAETGTLDFGFGMSSSWGDVNNDGRLDIYVSNVRSSQRWYGQAATLYQYLLNSLRQGTILEDAPLYREIYGFAGADWRDYGDRMVKGNTLLLQASDGQRTTFRDVAETANANPFGWYWGAAMLDYDNDGWLDLYGANGWITGKSHDDL